MPNKGTGAKRRAAAYRRGFEDARTRCARLAESVGRGDLASEMQRFECEPEGYVLSDFVRETIDALVDVVREHAGEMPLLDDARAILDGVTNREPA